MDLESSFGSLTQVLYQWDEQKQAGLYPRKNPHSQERAPMCRHLKSHVQRASNTSHVFRRPQNFPRYSLKILSNCFSFIDTWILYNLWFRFQNHCTSKFCCKMCKNWPSNVTHVTLESPIWRRYFLGLRSVVAGYSLPFERGFGHCLRGLSLLFE